MSDVGKIVRVARKSRRLRREDVAALAGTSRSTIARLEQGKKISDKERRRISQVLGVEKEVMGNLQPSPLASPNVVTGVASPESAVTVIGPAEGYGVFVSLLPGVFSRLVDYADAKGVLAAEGAAEIITEALRSYGTHVVKSAKDAESSDVGAGTLTGKKKAKRQELRRRSRVR